MRGARLERYAALPEPRHLLALSAVCSGGGRYMGDTTSLYLLEMYEIYKHTGNRTFVYLQWAPAKRAVAWMIGNARAGNHGLPQHLQTT